MSRIDDFNATALAAQAALADALDGTGDLTKSTRLALQNVESVLSELGLGDAPSEDPLVVSLPEPTP